MYMYVNRQEKENSEIGLVKLPPVCPTLVSGVYIYILLKTKYIRYELY